MASCTRQQLITTGWLTILLCFSFFVTTAVQANTFETAFLPVKIINAKDTEQLATNIDKLFSDNLDPKTFLLVDRTQATTLVDYQGAWPPSLKTLKAVSEKTATNTIIVGSFTQIGKQFSLDLKISDVLSPSNPVYISSQNQNLDNLEQAVSEICSKLISYNKKEVVISSIAPAGNKRIDSGAILRRIKTKIGSPFNPATLRDDLKAIYKMGYFDDVQVDISDGTDGREVIFRVVEKPVISSITYTGEDDIKEEDLVAVTNIKEWDILNPIKINKGVEGIKALYKSKGYYDTKVKADISYPTPEQAVVRYVIDEGSKIYIKTINFEGNETFDDNELADQIKTSKKWFMSWLTSSGLLKPEQIQQDADRILTFYNNNGFLQAKIGKPEIVQEGKWYYVTFNIEEGPRYRLGTVDIQGDLIADNQVLLELLSIRKEDFLSKQILRKDILKLTDFYAEKGYAFANIKPLMNKSVSGNRVDLVIDIQRGDLVYLNRITIEGNTRTRDNVIRRDLTIEEGGIFNSKALRESNEALQRLGFFEEVTITPEPTLDPSQMDISINVKEKSTGSFTIGAGYSSVDNLVFMGQISENNFLGRGDTLALSANVGGSSSRYNLAYTNPRLNDSNLSWGIDLYNTEREYDDYTRESVGGALRFGYPVWEKWKLFGKYSYTDSELSEVSDDASYIIRNSAKIPITSAVSASLVRDTRNRLFIPSKGSKNMISVKYAGGVLSGDAEFTKLEASSSWYFPAFNDTVFHIKGATGQVFENKKGKLPVYERFYLGGMNSVRGFEYGRISPLDPESNERIGGDKMWYTNLEWITPLLRKQGIYGAIFYDAGRVFDDDEDWGFDNISHTAGLELKWLSPLGLIRLVWGYNLDPADNEDQSVLDFSIGGSF